VLGGAGWGAGQIFTFIGICESFSYEKCFYGSYGDGNLGFDPLQMGKNPASLNYYKVRIPNQFHQPCSHIASRAHIDATHG
jgi:hypothetical protein